jgi:hypothetical protein
VNALKQIDMEKIRKAERATLCVSREATKNKTAQKKIKEDQNRPDDPEYGAGRH